MLHHTPTGDGLLFPAEFVRGELEYRTPGQKDAVLHGVARMADEDGDLRPARILFSQYHKTASLKGLALEGSVKFARPCPCSLLTPHCENCASNSSASSTNSGSLVSWPILRSI